MSEERKQVLEMLAQGKISTEDAERLLDRLNAVGAVGQVSGNEGTAEETAGKKNLKYLRVVVDSKKGDKVNIRVPLSLVRAGIKLKAMMPEQAQEKLAEKGVDLSHLGALQGDELTDALRELNIDVDSSDGDTVHVFCE